MKYSSYPLFLLIIFMLSGCSDPWSDISQKYSTDNTDNASFTSGRDIILLSPNHKGSHSYLGISHSFQKDGLFLKVPFPNTFFKKTIFVPSEAFTKCYHQNEKPKYNTSLWIKTVEVEIGLDFKDDTVYEFCKSQNIEIINRHSVSSYLN